MLTKATQWYTEIQRQCPAPCSYEVATSTCSHRLSVSYKGKLCEHVDVPKICGHGANESESTQMLMYLNKFFECHPSVILDNTLSHRAYQYPDSWRYVIGYFIATSENVLSSWNDTSLANQVHGDSFRYEEDVAPSVKIIISTGR